MQIAESPAALEWKRRKLNNGVSVPVTPLAAVIDNDIWAPDALTNAWRAAVLDFQVCHKLRISDDRLIATRKPQRDYRTTSPST
jgi:hypothetical protein